MQSIHVSAVKLPSANNDELIVRLRSLVEPATFISAYSKEIIMRNSPRMPVSMLESMIEKVEKGYLIIADLIGHFRTQKEEIAFETIDNERRINLAKKKDAPPDEQAIQHIVESLDTI